MTGPALWLVRHGETQWSLSGQHTSRTDLPLTEQGRQEALSVRDMLAGRGFDLVFSSPMQRARMTAQLAGFEAEVDPDLSEWDYGDLEGLTTTQVRERHPGWTVWKGPWPGGEDDISVASRADRFLERVRALGPGRSALVFAHGHILRVLTARWTGCPPAYGRLFSLGTATVSVLGWEHGEPAVDHWNVPPGFPPGQAETVPASGTGV